jgi:hypothetical protein
VALNLDPATAALDRMLTVTCIRPLRPHSSKESMAYALVLAGLAMIRPGRDTRASENSELSRSGTVSLAGEPGTVPPGPERPCAHVPQGVSGGLEERRRR